MVRRNSVAVFEARYKQRTTFDLDAPLVVQGNEVLPSAPNMFNGNSFGIDGGANNVGIATIDVNTADGISPTAQISSHVAANQADNITGMGLAPSIQDITASVLADPDSALLLDKDYLWDFVTNVVPGFADSIYSGNQNWAGGSAPDIGYYDATKPPNHPAQNPKVTVVNGDLSTSGNMTGGGLLLVRGKFTANGRFTFNGLILVIGAGEVDGGGLNQGIRGGMYIVNLTKTGSVLSFGTPKISMSGNSNILIDSQAIKMAVRILAPAQLSWREVTTMIDP